MMQFADIIRLTITPTESKGGGEHCKSFVILQSCRLGRLSQKKDFQSAYFDGADQRVSLSIRTKWVSKYQGFFFPRRLYTSYFISIVSVSGSGRGRSKITRCDGRIFIVAYGASCIYFRNLSCPDSGCASASFRKRAEKQNSHVMPDSGRYPDCSV